MTMDGKGVCNVKAADHIHFDGLFEMRDLFRRCISPYACFLFYSLAALSISILFFPPYRTAASEKKDDWQEEKLRRLPI